MIRFYTILISVFLITSCSAPEVADLTTDEVMVHGEFLFEGPNTLQGPSTLRLSELAGKAGVNPDQIKAVYVTNATLTFSPENSRELVESALVQWVSNDLPLVSVATKNPLPESGVVKLEVNAEQDILPYLKDSTSTLVVDVNVSGDLDELQASVLFDLRINY